MKMSSLFFAFALTVPSASYALDNACQTISDSAQSSVDSIRTKYNKQFSDNAEAVKKRAGEISDKANEDKPDNAAEGAIKFKIDVSWHTEKIQLDLPTVTVNDQEMVFDLPEVAVKQQSWKYDIPQTRMELRCIPGLPELVCSSHQECALGICVDIPDGCQTRPGSDICTEVPVVWMAPTETVLGVPEITMRRQSIVLGVPEFKMQTQEFSFDVPDFTLKDIEVEMDKVKKDSDELTAQSKENTGQLTRAMKQEIEVATAQIKEATFSCHRDNLEKNRTDALRNLDQNISVIQAGLAQALSVGATDLVAGMQRSMDQMIAARNKLNANFDAAVAKLAAGL